MRAKHYKILGLLHSKPILVTDEANPLTSKGLFTIKFDQQVLNENGLQLLGLNPQPLGLIVTMLNRRAPPSKSLDMTRSHHEAS